MNMTLDTNSAAVSSLYRELLEMHAYCRPAGSKTERKFIKRFLSPLNLKMDKQGNLYTRIGIEPVLWSCHTDTVHDKGGFQQLGYEKCGEGMEVGLREDTKSSCLGADDTVGVWLMVQMIRAQKPGLYIFHREEEVGCKGSYYIATQRVDLLEGIKFAIALDRKGQKSIITHQRSDRCCSDEFAKSLADALDEAGLPGLKADDGGIYTDTAEYTDLIGECTNVSIGYEGAHTKWERFNVNYAFDLLNALLALDLSKLVEKRKPGEVESKPYMHYSYADAGKHGFDEWGYRYYDSGSSYYSKYGSFPTKTSVKIPVVDAEEDDQAWKPSTWRRMISLIEKNPDAIATIIDSYGVTADDLEEEIMSLTGVVNH
jgi:hypothetical protein